MIALPIAVAAWLLVAGTLWLVARQCRRSLDAARASNVASRTEANEILDALKAENDRTARLNAIYAALLSGCTDGPEIEEARALGADAAETARWN